MTLEELNAQIFVAPFIDLEPHIKRGAVILIDESLDLAEVGLMLAKDDKDSVSKLISENLFTKASGADFENWRRDKRFFRLLIVQPFVIVQMFVALSEPKPN